VPATGGKTEEELTSIVSQGQKTRRVVIEIRNPTAARKPVINTKSSIASTNTVGLIFLRRFRLDGKNRLSTAG
jgi:hypothetical protein